MDSAIWCRTPAAASAERRLRPDVSKNSSTALSSNEGELARSITTCAPATASLTPSPVIVLTPLLGDAATTSWPPWRRMATVFEPIRPVPPMTTIFMVYAPLSTAQSCNHGVRRFPQEFKHRAGRLCATKVRNAQGIHGSCGGNVSRAVPDCAEPLNPIEPTPTGTANGKCGAWAAGPSIGPEGPQWVGQQTLAATS